MEMIMRSAVLYNATQKITASSILERSCSPSKEKTRIPIGKNWKKYHGANNWDGLLDPLDDTLRSELLRYGKFVQATYDTFDFNPASDTFGTSRFPKHSILSTLSGHPDTGYKVTRNLHASSGIEFPEWAQLGEVSSRVSKRTSWIGYVAVCQDEEEIARLGRRDVVIAFRGTATCLEWLENLRATMTRIPSIVPSNKTMHNSNAVMVERGFWSLFSSAGLSHPSLKDEIKDEVCRLMEVYSAVDGKIPLKITITGHSLGAAIAVLAAYHLKTTLKRNSPHVTVFSYGGPRVGNARFRRHVEKLGIKVLRIVNTRDIVTKVPGFLVDGRPSCWISKVGLAYSDVGQELRVKCSSKNMAACHDLNVYLQLIGERIESILPPRSTSDQTRYRWPSFF